MGMQVKVTQSVTPLHIGKAIASGHVDKDHMYTTNVTVSVEFPTINTTDPNEVRFLSEYAKVRTAECIRSGFCLGEMKQGVFTFNPLATEEAWGEHLDQFEGKVWTLAEVYAGNKRVKAPSEADIMLAQFGLTPEQARAILAANANK